jgi:thiol-disulfide isomerase/thioredoxin
MMNKLLAISSLVLAVSCSTGKTEEQHTLSSSTVKVTTLDGTPVKLQSLKGKVVFVNIWATWCRPCLEEMPSIISLKEQLGDKAIEFYFASDEETARIQSFITKRNMPGNFVRLENTEELSIQALPTTFIFGKNGELLFSEVGFRKWNDPSAIEMVTKYLQ